MIKVLNTNKQTLHLLTQVKDYYIESEIETADKMIHFLVPRNHAAYADLKQENYLQTSEDRFVIKEINYKDPHYVEVFGKLDVDALKSTIIPTYEQTYAPINTILTELLAGTGWTHVLHDLPSKLRTVRVEDKPAYDIILEAMNTFGFEVIFDTLEEKVHVYQAIGTDRGSYVYSDLNMKKLEFQSDTYDLRTRLYAYGKDGLTFASINGGLEYVENNSYSNKILETVWRDDRYTNAASLLADATAKLARMAQPRFTYVVDVLQLTNLNPIYTILDYQLGDMVKIIEKENSLIDSQRVVKLTSYPITPEKNKVELGNSKIVFKSNEEVTREFTISEITKVRTELMEEIEKTNDLIGGPETGYIITRTDVDGNVYEQLIMDTADIATATKVWRWNVNGLGYSSTGYNGNYSLALTSDGRINADFITTGGLNASIVEAGILTSNDGQTWIDLDTGAFNLKNQIVWDAVNSRVTFGSGVVLSWNDLTDTPTIVTSYNELADKPTIPTDYDDLNNLPTLVTSYTQLTDKPTIPVLPGYITSTKITSTQIESPSISAGTIYGTAISGSTMSAGTITGATIRTADSGVRIEIDEDGLRSYGPTQGRNGISIEASGDFGEMVLNNAIPKYVASVRHQKGDRVYTGPTLSGGNHMAMIYVYFNDTPSFVSPPNTSYWKALDPHYYKVPDRLIPSGFENNVYYTLSRTFYNGDIYVATTIDGDTVMMSPYFYSGSSRYNPPAPPDDTDWTLLGSGVAESPSAQEAIFGPVSNTNNYVGTDLVGAGIQSYFKHIQLKASKIPGTSFNDSGDVILTSTYGQVIAESSEKTIIRSQGDVLITTDYMANDTYHSGPAGNIVLAPYTEPGNVGEVIIEGSRIIRSKGTSAGSDLYLRAGTNGSANSIYLYGSYIMFNGSPVHTSDIKLKENIVDISSTLLDVADNIQFIDFNFKEKPEKKQIGAIAQWVEQAFDEQGMDAADYDIVTISEDDDGEDTKYVNYDSLMMLKIAALERRIKQLESPDRRVLWREP